MEFPTDSCGSGNYVQVIEMQYQFQIGNETEID